MLQKLRLKLILINVLSLSLVLLILFAGLYIVIRNIMIKQEDKLLAKVAAEEHYAIRLRDDEDNNGEILNPGFHTEIASDDETQMLSLFFVKKNKSGEITEISPNIFIDVESIKYLVEKVDAAKFKKGEIDIQEVQLSYLVEYKDYGSIYIFTDRFFREDMISKFLIFSVVGFLIADVAVLFASMVTSKKAIEPVREAMENQDKFIADASHELRTPLAVIRSNTELILDSPQTTVEENEKWLNYIHGETVRMTNMTENLLLLSKTGKTNQTENMDEVFSLTSLINNVCDNFEPLVNSYGLNFERDVKNNINFYASEERIRQLMSIFIDNACKYTKEGKISVNLENGEGSIKIIVSDTGTGIKEEDKEKIFERFYRVDKSRSRSLGGAGLGLSIAKNIVNGYGGKIFVESEYGTGTSFIITFNALSVEENEK